MSQDPPSVSLDVRVRYSETDQMGVVYHANYLVWCELGRTELIRRRGPSYADLEREGILLAVAEANVRYHAGARYDDLVRVHCWVEEVRSRMVTFAYRLERIDEDGAATRLATARTVLIAIDRNSRPRQLPPELVARLRDA